MDTERERDIAAANAGVTDSEGEDEDEDEAKDTDGAANGDKPADNDGAADEDKGVGSKVRIIWLPAISRNWRGYVMTCACVRSLQNFEQYSLFFQIAKKNILPCSIDIYFPYPQVILSCIEKPLFLFCSMCFEWIFAKSWCLLEAS